MKNKLKKIFKKFADQKVNVLSKLVNVKNIKINREKLKTIGRHIKKRFSSKLIFIFESSQNNEVIKNLKNFTQNKSQELKKIWSSDDPKYDQIKYQEIRYKATPKWTRSLQWAIVGCVGFGFTYSVVARIDEVVIAQGDLQSQGAERPIKSPTAGIVSSIPVKEGELVEKGQVILQFDQEINNSRILSINSQLSSEKMRLREEENAFNAKKDSLDSKLKSSKVLFETESIILDRYVNLLKVGAIAEIQMLQQKNKLVSLKSELEQLEASKKELSASYIKNIELARKEISVLERQLAETKKSQEYESFKSPIKGYVFGLVPSSPGYSVNNGEVLMNIVPVGDVQAKVFVTNRDVGFLKPEMDAKIRVNAYPFTQFGEIPGKLKLLGREVVREDQTNPEPKFPVIVELEKQFLERKQKKYPVLAGQTVSVNFVVRNKPVISLITDAVEKALDSLRGIKTDQP